MCNGDTDSSRRLVNRLFSLPVASAGNVSALVQRRVASRRVGRSAAFVLVLRGKEYVFEVRSGGLLIAL